MNIQKSEYQLLLFQDADKWLDTIKKNLRSETPQVLSEEEVTSHLREQVTAKFNQLSRAFADIDYARIGVVSKEDFQDVLNQFTIRLNEDQVGYRAVEGFSTKK